MKEACGLFGVFNTKTQPNTNTLKDVITGMKLLQHRGQDGCGVSYLNKTNDIVTIKKLGLVKNSFNDLPNINTHVVIGHVRYSTSGNSKNLDHTQPLYSHNNLGEYALAHNGNLSNVLHHDTYYLISFINNCKKLNWKDIFIEMLDTIPGVYCLLILTNEGIYAIRDKFGVRPLVMGCNGNDYCVSSETSAFHRFNFYCNINPGEIYFINKTGPKLLYSSTEKLQNICSFEYIYFLRPNSIVDNLNVQLVRTQLGKTLATKDIIQNNELVCKWINDETIVIGIPDSGIIAARAYADCLKLPYKQYIQKYENMNRSFIESNNTERNKVCKKKFYYDEKNLTGKNVIIVDDTIVRGNVIKIIIQQLKDIGVVDIHIRIPAPPIVNICKFGIDIPNKNELIATNNTDNKNIINICNEIGATSLLYLDVNDLENIISKNSCKGCFGGTYNNKLLEW
tara:strand:+ start:6830 stop:8185 length:1356 start_codon:yes stop_codon:yes gene_type:complete